MSLHEHADGGFPGTSSRRPHYTGWRVLNHVFQTGAGRRQKRTPSGTTTSTRPIPRCGSWTRTIQRHPRRNGGRPPTTKTASPRNHEIQKREQYISRNRQPEKAWRVFEIVTPFGKDRPRIKQSARNTPHLRFLRRIPGTFHRLLFDPSTPESRYRHTRRVLTATSAITLACAIPKVNTAFDCGEERDSLPGKRERASSSTIAASTRSITKQTAFRVVLIVDVMRPMPAPIHALNVFATRYLMRHLNRGKANHGGDPGTILGILSWWTLGGTVLLVPGDVTAEGAGRLGFAAQPDLRSEEAFGGHGRSHGRTTARSARNASGSLPNCDH
jgi:hypothetical protein